MHFLGRLFLIIFGAVFLLVVVLVVYFSLPAKLPPKTRKPLIIAHRGVHHTFPLHNLKNDTCTAALIYPPEHEYFENTIPSIRRAFELGADMVEIDIHPTVDHQLAVFHDWTLDCRTEGTGVTHEQTMAYLKTLDVGYGYTADGGKTFPLRGKGVGMIPTLDEILLAFPDKKIGIDQKDTFERTITLLAETLKKYPKEQRERIYFFSGAKEFAQLKREIPEVQKIIPTRGEEKSCVWDYAKMLFSGRIADNCRQWAFGAPYNYLNFIPGWPYQALAQARQAGLQVFVVEVDTAEAYSDIHFLPIDGIITNRIELIGPLVAAE